MSDLQSQQNSNNNEVSGQQRVVHITDKPFYRYSYHPSLSSSALQTFSHYVSGKCLRGEHLWKQAPTINDSLHIGKLLGKGGYGEVYEIWKITEPQHRFALKIPGPPLSITKNYILNEIQKLKLLGKPGNVHIPKIKDGFFYLNNERIPYYITHILTSVEKQFSCLLKSNPINPLIAVLQFYFLSAGLKYITSHHIVHNDIKPENIMFYKGLPIITDYGTARSYSEINEIEFERLQGRLHGTPTWLPPELITITPNPTNPQTYLVYYNLSNVGQKTDVWGLALVWMKYLTGESLFHDVPIRNYQVPEIFFTTYQQFNEAKIVSRYRAYTYRKLSRYCESFQWNKKITDISAGRGLDVEQLKILLFDDPKTSTEKLKEHYNMVQGTKDVSSMNTGRMLTAKICLKKLQFLSRQRSDVEIKEFFIASLFDIFDLCIAPVETRIKSYQLVDILEILFPGILSICQKQLEDTIFPELIFSEMVS